MSAFVLLDGGFADAVRGSLGVGVELAEPQVAGADEVPHLLFGLVEALGYLGNGVPGCNHRGLLFSGCCHCDCPKMTAKVEGVKPGDQVSLPVNR